MDVRQELSSIGFNPSGSQHFLRNEIAVRKFLSEAETSGKTVLEIGAGTGSISRHVEADKAYLVEKDPSLAQILKQSELGTDYKVMQEDFMELEVPDDVNILIGNLPFHLASDIIERLSTLQLRSVLIVQEEMADKAVAAPEDPEYNFFSFKMSYYFVPVKSAVISSENYYPQPEVDTAVLKLYPGRERHDISDEENFMQFAKALFTHRRKKLRNALVDGRNMIGGDKDSLKQVRDNVPHSEEKVFHLDVKKMHEAFLEFRAMSEQAQD
ncbi:MAG: dimethyladenosine transferase, rRNA methylation [Candidatus Nanosalina sp. J07AB43]|nr:MAG: dimethyladenosine transferase, rRNA methylation [Candidatus Nanosalina sp. J07AB43]